MKKKTELTIADINLKAGIVFVLLVIAFLLIFIAFRLID